VSFTTGSQALVEVELIFFGPAPGSGGFALGAALSLDLLEGVGNAPEDPQDIHRVGSNCAKMFVIGEGLGLRF